MRTDDPCVYTRAEKQHTIVKDSVVHVRVRWIMETLTTTHTKNMCCRLGSVTVAAAFPGKSDPIFLREKPK